MNIYMNPKLEFKLREYANKNDIPMSQVLSEALEAYMTPIEMAYDPVSHEVHGKPAQPILEVKGNDAMQKFLKQQKGIDKAQGVTYEPFE
jgi:hypothetical protein